MSQKVIGSPEFVAEDLIIYKLWYYRISRQTKHPRDIYAMLSAQGIKLISITSRSGLIEKD